jgi:hypothetical protein
MAAEGEGPGAHTEGAPGTTRGARAPPIDQEQQTEPPSAGTVTLVPPFSQGHSSISSTAVTPGGVGTGGTPVATQSFAYPGGGAEGAASGALVNGRPPSVVSVRRNSGPDSAKFSSTLPPGPGDKKIPPPPEKRPSYGVNPTAGGAGQQQQQQAGDRGAIAVGDSGDHRHEAGHDSPGAGPTTGPGDGVPAPKRDGVVNPVNDIPPLGFARSPASDGSDVSQDGGGPGTLTHGHGKGHGPTRSQSSAALLPPKQPSEPTLPHTQSWSLLHIKDGESPGHGHGGGDHHGHGHAPARRPSNPALPNAGLHGEGMGHGAGQDHHAHGQHPSARRPSNAGVHGESPGHGGGLDHHGHGPHPSARRPSNSGESVHGGGGDHHPHGQGQGHPLIRRPSNPALPNAAVLPPASGAGAGTSMMKQPSSSSLAPTPGSGSVSSSTPITPGQPTVQLRESCGKLNVLCLVIRAKIKGKLRDIEFDFHLLDDDPEQVGAGDDDDDDMMMMTVLMMMKDSTDQHL